MYDTLGLAYEVQDMLKEASKKHGLKKLFRNEEEEKTFKKIVSYSDFVMDRNDSNEGWIKEAIEYCHIPSKEFLLGPGFTQTDMSIKMRDTRFDVDISYTFEQDYLDLDVTSLGDGHCRSHFYVDRNEVKIYSNIENPDFDEGRFLGTVQDFLDDRIHKIAEINKFAEGMVRYVVY